MADRRAEQVIEAHLFTQGLDLIDHLLGRALEHHIAHVARHRVFVCGGSVQTAGVDGTAGVVLVGVGADRPGGALFGDPALRAE